MSINAVLRTSLIGVCAALGLGVASVADVDKTVVQKDGWVSYGKQLGQKVDSVN